jgi:adenylate cyclase
VKKIEHRRLSLLLPVLLVLAGLAALVLDPLPLRMARNLYFDQYQRWAPRDYEPVPVRIVDIDDASLTRLGQWPWPRTRIAELVTRLEAAGVAAIGFDVMFAEADRTSPRSMAQMWPLPPAMRDALMRLPDHDQVLAQVLEGAPVVLGFAVQRQQAPAGGAPSDSGVASPRYRYIHSGPSSERWFHRFQSAVESRPELEAVAQGSGALSFVSDADGVVRRVPLVLQLGERPIPTLVAESLRVAQGQRNYLLKTEDEDVGLSSLRIGPMEIPTTPQGEMWVHYTRDVPQRYIPAWKLFAGEVDDAALEGHIVLVGSSAQGLMDLRFSPLGRLMPGVEAHAQALEQALSGHFLRRPGWATAAEGLALVLGGFLAGFLSIRSSALRAAGATAALLALLLGGGWLAYREHFLLFNTVTPALTMVTAFVLGSLVHHFVSEREQRWIKTAFSRYVSPNRVSYLVEHPDAMELGGRRQECSFIFTDLAGFTTLMENIDPGEAVALLNDYLDQMIAIAFRHEGTLDRIVGDAVAIMFSAPVPQPDHRSRALACALEMDAYATRYARDLNARGIPFGMTRIGVHTGEVIIGNFGGSTMFDYRALGDPVNTASRLEGVNKFLGTLICVSAETLSGCPGAQARRVGRLVLKGKSRALQVCEPLDGRDTRHYAPQAEYDAAYDLMAASDIPAAAAAFAGLHERWPHDPLVVLHHERLQQRAEDDVIRLSEK